MAETLEFDIVIVGGGPAGLSAALRLSRRLRADNGPPVSIAVIDKARDAGAHELSGAVLDPSVLFELMPNALAEGAPLGSPVTTDALYYLTTHSAWRSPIIPPPLANRGHYVVSLASLVRWMAARVESAGIDLFSGFSADEVLFDGLTVAGVRTGDRGLDREGRHKPNFEPGVELRAKVTIFCDGVRGNLTKQLVRTLALDRDRRPQLYALGIKELWELPAGRVAGGSVVHTLGFPLRSREFGGGFIYGLDDTRAALGLVSGLDFADPMFDPYLAFQRFKTHPFVARLLEGGRLVRYGAKALPEGGWHTIPRPYMDGGLIAGDAGAFLNSMRLKGIHLAMRTGMQAADAAFDAVRAGDTSATRLAAYERALNAGPVWRELYPVRNVHQAFERGLVPGLAFAGWSLLTRGWWFVDPLPARAGYERLKTRSAYYGEAAPPLDAPAPAGLFNRVTTFDRLTAVHYSGTHHREDAPSHLLVHDLDICRTKCRVEYGNPCTRYCPAQVYEMVDDGQGGKRLSIAAANCVHCRTCDIMDPYQIVDWVPPEGGDGPGFEGM